MARRPSEDSWLLIFGFETGQAVDELNSHISFLESSLASVTDGRVTRWLKEDIKKTRLLRNQFSSRARVGILGEIVTNATDKLLTRVLSDWNGLMNQRTGDYVSAITKSQNFREDGRVFSAVGSKAKLTSATSSSKGKASGWTIAGSGRSLPIKAGGGGDKAERTIAAGYWYFQEYGFEHYGSKTFVHNPVFSIQEGYIKELGEDAIREYERKVKLLLGKRYGSFG